MDVKIEHTTLAEKAYAQLRSGLISAQFRPGETIRIRTLADQYGISATPVREAMQRLVAENALEMQPNKSFQVPILTVERFQEIRRMRIALEPMAAELAYKNLVKRDLRALDDLVEDMDDATQQRNIGEYIVCNERFHFLIYEKSDAPLLLGVISDLWVLAAPFFSRLFEGSEYLKKSNHWHKKTLAAYRKNDVEGFGECIRQDILLASETLLSKLNQEFEKGSD
ncbi:MAG: GntR family transcriptional regulator [Hyphomicrobiaceae bacterium]|nr:GntR family transcriptional regulator [Hyphomicrobiaceae bacterium]